MQQPVKYVSLIFAGMHIKTNSTKRCSILLIVVLLPFMVQAQWFPQKNYPQNYFGWPVNAIKAIVANFGELRPNHYHMGLDCRTEQVQNKQVLAAADGYIAKVKIEPWGFGRAIYINHPNGLTTLYAHLNDFTPGLEQYVRKQQYQLQKWQVLLDIPANMFPVKKGDFIAYSGTTGGSQGPHVHFEIRDTKTDKVLNPLLFNMPITDKIAPDIIRLAYYDRNKSTYEQTPKYVAIKKINGIYTPHGGVLNVSTGKISFAITAFDRYTGSTNHNGIYEAILYENNNPVCGFQMDSISYDETRMLNAHIDYKTKASGGPYLQHLSRLGGAANIIYKTNESNGVISLNPGETKDIKIEVYDADLNKSELKFTLKRSLADITYPVQPGTLFIPQAINIFENEEVKFYLPENSIYDSFYFKYNKINVNMGKPVHQLHHHTVPVQNYFTVQIRDNILYMPTDKMVMKWFAGSKTSYKKAVPVITGPERGWYSASWREFGNFQLMEDSEPPTITPLGFKDGMNTARLTKISFAVKDNTEEIENFTGQLDGKWILFSNDKGRVFVYEFDEACGPGEHELKLTATDQAGNTTEKTYRFTR